MMMVGEFWILELPHSYYLVVPYCTVSTQALVSWYDTMVLVDCCTKYNYVQYHSLLTVPLLTTQFQKNLNNQQQKEAIQKPTANILVGQY